MKQIQAAILEMYGGLSREEFSSLCYTIHEMQVHFPDLPQMKEICSVTFLNMEIGKFLEPINEAGFMSGHFRINLSEPLLFSFGMKRKRFLDKLDKKYFGDIGRYITTMYP